MLRMRSLLPPLLFTLAYAAISLGVTNSYYQLILTLVPVWAVFGLSWNLLERLHRADLVRPRRLLRDRRLCDRARPDLFRHLALAADPGRRHARRHRRAPDRISDLPPAGPLLRAGDARLPARHSLRVRVARLPGGDASDQARRADRLYAVRRSPHLHAAGAGHHACHHRADAGDRAIPLRHGAARDQAERGCGRSGRTSTRWPGSCARSR